MTFLNQAILFGLIAVSIPILIHLFNRRKAQVVEWGAMQFLLGSLVNRRRRILVEELILMTLRCLLIAAMVLAVARPFAPVGTSISWLLILPLLFLGAVLVALATILARTRKWRWISYALGIMIAGSVFYLSQNQKLLQATRWKSSTEQDVAIIIDGSDSMRIVVDGKSNFDRAVGEARKLIESLGSDDSVSILIAGGATKLATPEPFNVREDYSELLESLQPSSGEFDVATALKKSAGVLAAGKLGTKKVILISDGQANQWDSKGREEWKFIEKSFEQLPTKPKVIVRFLPLPNQFQNASIASFELSRKIIGTDREVLFQVRVENTGFSRIEPGGLHLEIEGVDQPYTEQLDPIEPGESAQVTFQHRFESAGSVVV